LLASISLLLGWGLLVFGCSVCALSSPALSSGLRLPLVEEASSPCGLWPSACSPHPLPVQLSMFPRHSHLDSPRSPHLAPAQLVFLSRGHLSQLVPCSSFVYSSARSLFSQQQLCSVRSSSLLVGKLYAEVRLVCVAYRLPAAQCSCPFFSLSGRSFSGLSFIFSLAAPPFRVEDLWEASARVQFGSVLVCLLSVALYPPACPVQPVQHSSRDSSRAAFLAVMVDQCNSVGSKQRVVCGTLITAFAVSSIQRVAQNSVSSPSQSASPSARFTHQFAPILGGGNAFSFLFFLISSFRVVLSPVRYSPCRSTTPPAVFQVFSAAPTSAAVPSSLL
jgi:hypothetical protein